jgi:hypothetical protein
VTTRNTFEAGASRYAQARPPARDKLREEPLRLSGTRVDELAMQARWFAGEFGTQFESTTGESVRIVQFGVWNREAGPDFAEAAVSINGGPPERGCIELDPDARDWERHRHSLNPDYESVVLHLFFECGDATSFTRTASHRNIPQVLLDASKAGGGAISVPAAKPGRCVAPLRDMPREKVADVLDAAAQFRVQRKAARMAGIEEAHGADEALYQSLAATLGYKGNTLPFTLLAQRLPVKRLLHEKEAIDALLFGAGGFLASTDMSQFPSDTRAYLRETWEGWWPRRHEWQRLALASDRWRTGGVRPANHPQRRVAALAQIVKHWPKVTALKESCEPGRIRDFFAGLHDDYWDSHFTLTSKKMPAPMALAGQSRVTEMLANVFFPLAILGDPRRWSDYAKLPAASSNRRVETAAIRLFGGMPAARDLLKTAARQQGLLQIYEDFCMHDNTDCAECLFPKQVAQWA